MLRGIVYGLAALLALACGLAAVGVRAQDPVDPLTLELQSSRNLCTAGTPTEISWEIAGGVPPYTLSIEGSAVDVAAESHRINCGALTEAEATDEDAPLAAKRVTATVTDSRGVQRKASLDVARARPLPAPTATARVWPNPNAIAFEWPGARGSAPCDVEEPFAVRWRRRGATEWSHNLYQSSSQDPCKVRLPIRGLEEAVAYEASIAALRDPIELNNPEALQWTRAAQGTTVTTPSGVTVNATHNSVTVRWNQQPSAYWYTVSLAGPNGGLSTQLARDLDEFAWRATANGMHEVVFRHLPPATAFTVYVGIPTTVHEKRLSTKTRVQTKAAPADWTPLPRGAQNVRASATADSITVRWDAPFVGADDRYEVIVYHPHYPSKPLFKWVYRNEFSQGGLETGVTYRVIIEHDGVVKAPKEIQVTTIAETPGKARRTPPPFEWWANGRSTTPLLYLQLTSSRDVCTAGTLTELSWQIAGGVPPYTLSVEGETVDADAESHRINCGALTEAEATDEDAPLAAKQITATVADSRGVQREASLDVERARPLPAPMTTPLITYGDAIVTEWLTSDSKPDGATSLFLIRWRPATSTEWSYRTLEHTHDPLPVVHLYLDGLGQGIDYRFEFAAMRDHLETETPAALPWSRRSTTTLADPTGLSATATHNTVTVTWDAQPAATFFYVDLDDLSDGYREVRDSEIYTPTEYDGKAHTVVFRNVPPDHAYTVRVQVGSSFRSQTPEPLETTTTVRTTLPPSGWTAPHRGAQRVRSTATTNSITVAWDAPYPDAAEDDYHLMLFHPTRSGIRHERVYNGTTTFTFDNLEPGLTYRVVIDHIAIVERPVELSVTTLPTSTSALHQAPLFEWWANGKPATPPPYLKLTSSRNLCTAGTLTELSWQIAGGVPPYTLSVEGETVDVDADNLRINCGALPTDPRTGELAASRTKTFRGSLRDSRDVTATAIAPVTLTTPPYLAADTALRYETYDLTGAAASAGSYTFLTDATSAASVVTTYEGLRDGTAKLLLVHKADAQGVSRATLYAAVAAGDLFEWRESYDCWVRYRVTEVRPDPSGAAARKLFGVERVSYAFTGCSGAIATDAAVLIAWGPLPDLGGPSLAAPLRHGPYQLVPEDWAGRVEEDPFRPWPGNSYNNPVHTAELAEARRLPYWRDPTLPTGWTFSGASSGASSFDPPHGYCSYWQNDRGYGGVEICGGFDASQGYLRESSSHVGGPGGIIETRMIDGRSSLVMYSPAGPKHNRYYSIQVRIYDPISDATYLVRGLDWTLNGSNVDAVIEIARSLFTTAAPTASDAASAGASGNRDALPFVWLTLQREGRA